MSEVEHLVLGELRKEQEMKPIERALAGQGGKDATRLWSKPITISPSVEVASSIDFGLCATAVVETVFRKRLPAPSDPELARLNRRACFGSFFVENGRLG